MCPNFEFQYLDQYSVFSLNSICIIATNTTIEYYNSISYIFFVCFDVINCDLWHGFLIAFAWKA